MNKLTYRHLFTYLFTYLSLTTLLFAAGWYAHGWYHGFTCCHSPRRVSVKGFHFTSPLLDVELPEGNITDNEPNPSKQNVESFVQKQIESRRVREVSVYYRDLHDGPWFGINEDREFNPASMMKVPVMIAWLKRAETDHRVLERTMVYDSTVDMTILQDIRPAYTITPGRRYTIEELLHYMVQLPQNKMLPKGR